MTDAMISRGADLPDGPQGMLRIGGAETGGRFDFLVSSVPFGAGPPLHVHDEQDDTIFVLEGVLTLQVGDDLVELAPGDFATVPPSVAHTFSNTDADQGPVRMVNVMTPGGFDDYLKEMLTLGGPPDETAMSEIGRRHGISWVGPTIAGRLGLS